MNVTLEPITIVYSMNATFELITIVSGDGDTHMVLPPVCDLFEYPPSLANDWIICANIDAFRKMEEEAFDIVIDARRVRSINSNAADKLLFLAEYRTGGSPAIQETIPILMSRASLEVFESCFDGCSILKHPKGIFYVIIKEEDEP